MEQAINTAEINKSSIVGEIFDLSLHNNILFDVLERLIFSSSVLFLNYGFA